MSNCCSCAKNKTTTICAEKCCNPCLIHSVKKVDSCRLLTAISTNSSCCDCPAEKPEDFWEPGAPECARYYHKFTALRRKWSTEAGLGMAESNLKQSICNCPSGPVMPQNTRVGIIYRVSMTIVLQRDNTDDTSSVLKSQTSLVSRSASSAYANKTTQTINCSCIFEKEIALGLEDDQSKYKIIEPSYPPKSPTKSKSSNELRRSSYTRHPNNISRSTQTELQKDTSRASYKSEQESISEQSSSRKLSRSQLSQTKSSSDNVSYTETSSDRAERIRERSRPSKHENLVDQPRQSHSKPKAKRLSSTHKDDLRRDEETRSQSRSRHIKAREIPVEQPSSTESIHSKLNQSASSSDNVSYRETSFHQAERTRETSRRKHEVLTDQPRESYLKSKAKRLSSTHEDGLRRDEETRSKSRSRHFEQPSSAESSHLKLDQSYKEISSHRAERTRKTSSPSKHEILADQSRQPHLKPKAERLPSTQEAISRRDEKMKSKSRIKEREIPVEQSSSSESSHSKLDQSYKETSSHRAERTRKTSSPSKHEIFADQPRQPHLTPKAERLSSTQEAISHRDEKIRSKSRIKEREIPVEQPSSSESSHSKLDQSKLSTSDVPHTELKKVESPISHQSYVSDQDISQNLYNVPFMESGSRSGYASYTRSKGESTHASYTSDNEYSVEEPSSNDIYHSEHMQIGGTEPKFRDRSYASQRGEMGYVKPKYLTHEPSTPSHPDRSSRSHVFPSQTHQSKQKQMEYIEPKYLTYEPSTSTRRSRPSHITESTVDLSFSRQTHRRSEQKEIGYVGPKYLRDTSHSTRISEIEVDQPPLSQIRHPKQKEMEYMEAKYLTHEPSSRLSQISEDTLDQPPLSPIQHSKQKEIEYIESKYLTHEPSSPPSRINESTAVQPLSQIQHSKQREMEYMEPKYLTHEPSSRLSHISESTSHRPPFSQIQHSKQKEMEYMEQKYLTHEPSSRLSHISESTSHRPPFSQIQHSKQKEMEYMEPKYLTHETSSRLSHISESTSHRPPFSQIQHSKQKEMEYVQPKFLTHEPSSPSSRISKATAERPPLSQIQHSKQKEMEYVEPKYLTHEPSSPSSRISKATAEQPLSQIQHSKQKEMEYVEPKYLTHEPSTPSQQDTNRLNRISEPVIGQRPSSQLAKLKGNESPYLESGYHTYESSRSSQRDTHPASHVISDILVEETPFTQSRESEMTHKKSSFLRDKSLSHSQRGRSHFSESVTEPSRRLSHISESSFEQSQISESTRLEQSDVTHGKSSSLRDKNPSNLQRSKNHLSESERDKSKPSYTLDESQLSLPTDQTQSIIEQSTSSQLNRLKQDQMHYSRDLDQQKSYSKQLPYTEIDSSAKESIQSEQNKSHASYPSDLSKSLFSQSSHPEAHLKSKNIVRSEQGKSNRSYEISEDQLQSPESQVQRKFLSSQVSHPQSSRLTQRSPASSERSKSGNYESYQIQQYSAADQGQSKSISDQIKSYVEPSRITNESLPSSRSGKSHSNYRSGQIHTDKPPSSQLRYSKQSQQYSLRDLDQQELVSDEIPYAESSRITNGSRPNYESDQISTEKPPSSQLRHSKQSYQPSSGDPDQQGSLSNQVSHAEASKKTNESFASSHQSQHSKQSYQSSSEALVQQELLSDQIPYAEPNRVTNESFIPSQTSKKHSSYGSDQIPVDKPPSSQLHHSKENQPHSFEDLDQIPDTGSNKITNESLPASRTDKIHSSYGSNQLPTDKRTSDPLQHSMQSQQYYSRATDQISSNKSDLEETLNQPRIPLNQLSDIKSNPSDLGTAIPEQRQESRSSNLSKFKNLFKRSKSSSIRSGSIKASTQSFPTQLDVVKSPKTPRKSL